MSGAAEVSLADASLADASSAELVWPDAGWVSQLPGGPVYLESPQAVSSPCTGLNAQARAAMEMQIPWRSIHMYDIEPALARALTHLTGSSAERYAAENAREMSHCKIQRHLLMAKRGLMVWLQVHHAHHTAPLVCAYVVQMRARLSSPLSALGCSPSCRRVCQGSCLKTLQAF